MPADYGVHGDFSGASDLSTLKNYARLITGLRISGKAALKNRHLLIARNDVSTAEAFRDLLQSKGYRGYDWDGSPAGLKGESRWHYKTEAACSNAYNYGSAVLALGRKLQTVAGTYTIDSAYAGGGKVVKASSGGTTVSFYIPYDNEKAEKNRSEVTRDSEVSRQTAEDRQATAEADQAAEKAVASTQLGKTLRWIGIATVALIVIGAIALIVYKSKKK